MVDTKFQYDLQLSFTFGVCLASPAGEAVAVPYATHSAHVLHLIDGLLTHRALGGGGDR